MSKGAAEEQRERSSDLQQRQQQQRQQLKYARKSTLSDRCCHLVYFVRISSRGYAVLCDHSLFPFICCAITSTLSFSVIICQ
jgi:hypothetical protein